MVGGVVEEGYLPQGSWERERGREVEKERGRQQAETRHTFPIMPQ